MSSLQETDSSIWIYDFLEPGQNLDTSLVALSPEFAPMFYCVAWRLSYKSTQSQSARVS